MITVAYTAFVLLLGCFIKENDRRQRYLYLIISSIVLVLISGWRSYFLGSGDTLRYAFKAQSYINESPATIYALASRDPIYHVVTSWILKLVNYNFHYVLIFYASLFMIILDVLWEKESPNILVSFIVLFSLGFFSFTMNGLRQSIAIAFILLSYFPLKNKKLLKFCTLVLIAACFHKTALIFLIAYPLVRFGFNDKVIFIYLILTIILFLFGEDIVKDFAEEMSEYDDRFEYYAQTTKTLTYSGFIQIILFWILIMSHWESYSTKDKEAPVLMTLLSLAAITQSCAVFIAEMFRVAMYFSIFLTIMIPRFFTTLPFDRRRYVTVGLSILLLLYFYSNSLNLEYDFYWNDSAHYYDIPEI